MCIGFVNEKIKIAIGKDKIKTLFAHDVSLSYIEHNKSSKRYVYTDGNYKYEVDSRNTHILTINILPTTIAKLPITKTPESKKDAGEIAYYYLTKCIGDLIEGELTFSIKQSNTSQYWVDIIEKINNLETGTSCGIGLNKERGLITARFTIGKPQKIRNINQDSLLKKDKAIEIAIDSLSSELDEENIIHIISEMHTYSNGTIYWSINITLNNGITYTVHVNALSGKIIGNVMTTGFPVACFPYKGHYLLPPFHRTVFSPLKANKKSRNPLLLQGISTSFHTAPGRIRTGDLRITNASLYRLSHGSV